MGNSRSQPCQPRRQMYLLYLINRAWNRMRMRDKEKYTSDNADRDTEISSRCSGCKGCDYQHDSLIFDSESEMAPNAEEEMLAVKPWGIQQDKERLRPPTYNAEDYAMALRRWGRRPITSAHDPQGTLPSTTSSSSGYVSGSGEMTLRQFTSVSELLNKLRADLRLAFPSFVQEFASSPADGITLLLETLRGVQLVQSTPPSGQSGPRIGTRRAALDELGCVECLAACAERCADAPRLLSQAQPGLLALAVCLTSSLNRSRVLALQLLTKVCQTPGGHAAVSEAVSTLRLRYGEGGRFRFLAGALLAPRAAIALRVAGISFLNSFLKSAPRTQTRLYIQAEACEAGLEPRILQEWLTEVEGRCEDTLTDLLRKEVQKWSQNCVDVDALQKRLVRAEETCTILGNKVALLQDQLSKLQIEKRNGFNLSELNVESITKNQVETQRLSSNGEDEGISSSERSSSPDDLLRQNREIDNKTIDNDQETTIDDVIEELRIIVKDAEEEDRKGQENFLDTSRIISDRSTTTKLSLNHDGKIAQDTDNITKSKRDKLPNISKHSKKIPINYGNFTVEEDFANEIDHTCLSSAISKTPPDGGSLKIVVKGADVEEAIVPAILYPQPPRRTPPCLSTILATTPDEFLEHPVIYHSHDDEDAEEETLGDGSDSLLSASRLKYNTNEQSTDVEGQLYLSKNGVTSRDQFHIDQRNERKEKKTLRNYDAGVKSINDLNHAQPNLEVYRQFESVAKSNERTRYKSEIEKKKLLRRSVSHDFLNDQNNSSLHSRKSASKVEGRIRKFESMNSFDNCIPQNLSRNSSRRRTCDNTNARRIRRSESCHQVSHLSRKENSSQGGSDSGLRYITDFDMEPMITRRLRSTEVTSEPSNQLAKSLDRIDEGLDSLVDIVIGGSKDNGHAQKIRRKFSTEKDFRNFRLEDKQQSMVSNIFLEQARPSKKSSTTGSEIKNGTRGSGNNRPKSDDHYNGLYNSSVLRNDELYQMDRVHRNHQNELNLYGKMPNFINDINNSSIISSFHYEKSPNKFLINDSGIFLASGKPHDAFGLGKNRFNAGKYSGNPPSTDNIGLRRNSVSSLAAKCGKVTDILSGLY